MSIARGDPYPDLTLQGGDVPPDRPVNRLASPLILRPLLAANGRAYGLAVVLDSPRVPKTGLALKQGRNQSFTVSEKLTDVEAAALTVNLRPLNNKTDVLQAFLDTL